MTKEELRELAQWGMRRKLREMEEQLEEYRKEFPDLFVSQTKVVLLKAEAREGGASAWAELPPLPRQKLLPAAPREPGPSHRERLLAHLAEHPLLTSRELARALDMKTSSASSSLWGLKKKRKVWQPEQDARWALRQKIKAVPATASTAKTGGHPKTLSGRILAHLAETGQPFRNGQLATRFKAGTSTVDSALQRARKRGEVVHEDGRWRAISAPRSRKSPKPGPNRKFWKERWYAYLQQHGPTPLHVAGKTLHANTASLLTSAVEWLKAGVIQKTDPGVYGIGLVKPDPAALAEAAQYVNQNGASA